MAFLEEDADSYGDLWQFKQHITQYTFGIAKQKGYVFVRYKIDDIPQFYKIDDIPQFSKQLLSWQEGTARSVVKKLRGVWLTLDRYAIVIAAKAASAKKGIKRQPAGVERGETTPKKGRGGSRPGSSRAEAQKRNPAQSRDSGEGTRKRSKPSGPERTPEAEGSASSVTTAETRTSRSVPPAEDFEKFAFI